MYSKNLNLILLFALLFYSLLQVCAQEKAVLIGRIIDAETGKPVSYATAEIKSKRLGAAANAEGIINVSVSDSLINETFTFSALAYTSRQIPVKQLLQDQPFVVQLTKKVFTLPEFTMRETNLDKVQLGNYINNQFVSSSGSKTGMIVAVYMDNKNGCNGIISSVSYLIIKRDRFTRTHPKTPFRIRIFAVDTMTGEPGVDLLAENLIVKPKGDGWFTVDVSKYNIEAPEEGYFAAMEWVFTKEKYYYHIYFKENPEQFYGQSLGIIVGDFSPNTWSKYLGYDWYVNNKENTGRHKGKFTNSLINSEIDCFK